MANLTILLQRLKEDVSGELRVAMPGKVVSYNFQEQKAEIKIDMKELYSNDLELDYPIVSSVPVLFLNSGGASITAPVKPGDTCLLIFNDRDLTSWLLGARGERPETRRLHTINDAVAIMGLRSFTEVSPAQNNDDLLITYDGSEVVLKPNGNLDILTGSTVNIKTDKIVINCNNAEINAEEQIKVKCSQAFVQAENEIDVTCKEANVTAELAVTTKCENSIIKASNNATVIAKNSYIQAEESVNLVCKNLNASVSEMIMLQSDETTINAINDITINADSNVNINAAENLTVTSKNTSFNITEDANLNCKNVTITSSETATIGCKNAVINAAENITTTATKFTHTGSFVVNGATKIVGGVAIQGGLTNTGGTLSSNGTVLETHIHPYTDSVGEPPVPVPSTTGTPV